jgi:hypothetical protein
MLTFLDTFFDKSRLHNRVPQSPQKRKTEYHGVATAVGKISKRLHNLEQALESTVKEDTPTPVKKSEIPAPQLITTETPIVPPVVTPPKTETVTKQEEAPIVALGRLVQS